MDRRAEGWTDILTANATLNYVCA